MNKCKKCRYYYPAYDQCTWCGRSECKENCNRFELRADILSADEISKLTDDDLLEQYKTNNEYCSNYPDGEAYKDYVKPLRLEIERRGLK